MRAHADGPPEASAVRVFWSRFTDNLLRRRWLFLLPVLLTVVIGVLQISRVVPVYESQGVLSVARNPYLESSDLAVESVASLDLDAEAVGGLLIERLSTDAFVREVAETAGLGERIERGDVTLRQIRREISVGTSGGRLVVVGVRWGSAETSRSLAAATIAAFDDFVTETLVTESATLEAEYRARVEIERAQTEAATAEYDSYVATLPPGSVDDLTTIERLRLDRLTERLQSAQDAEDAALRLVDVVVNIGRQVENGSWELIRVVDDPPLPSSPTTDAPPLWLSVGGFALLGILVASGAAFATTALDRSISTPVHLAFASGVTAIIPIEPLRARDWRAARSSAVAADLPSAAAPADDEVSVG
jgi:hypothetical protein